MSQSKTLTLLNRAQFLDIYPLEYNEGYSSDKDANPFPYPQHWPKTQLDWVHTLPEVSFTSESKEYTLREDILQALAWQTGQWERQVEDILYQFEPHQILFGTGHRQKAFLNQRHRKEFKEYNLPSTGWWYYKDDTWLAKQNKCLIRKYLEWAIVQGVRCVITGAAMFFDRYVEEIWQELMKESEVRAMTRDKEVTVAGSDLYHIMAIPCRGQHSQWKNAEKERYLRLLDRASYVHLLDRRDFKSYPSCMQVRNEWMVDHAGIGLTNYMTQLTKWNVKSGTKNCLQYALKQKKRVVGFHAITKEFYRTDDNSLIA